MNRLDAQPHSVVGGSWSSPPAALVRLSSPVFAARVDELELLGRAVCHPPAMAMVEGEAGVGKTRLVAELAAQVGAEGRRVLVGHCHPWHEPFPLGPVIEAIRTLGDELGTMTLSPLADALRPVLPELAPATPEPLGDRHMERHHLWQALVEVLGALGPALLVLEDLHWADDSTLQFLSFLAAQQPPELAVVATFRADDPAAPSPLGSLGARLPASTSTLRIRLGPLGPHDVKVMIGAILDTEAVSEEFASYLHQRTAGIPLAVEEVLRLLVDRKDIVRWRGQWARRALEAVEVPVAIRDSMLERVGALDPDARMVVEAAAVVAEPASEALLEAVAGLSSERVAAGLTAALAAGIVQAAGAGYAFRHALAVQAVADAIAAPQRRRLHQLAAEALEAGDTGAFPDPHLPARLAHHWRNAGDSQRWVRWAKVAAAMAVTLGDPVTAAAILLHAVSAPGLGGEERGLVALALSLAAIEGKAHTEAANAVQEVLDGEVLPPELRGRLRANLGILFHLAGDASRAHAEFALAVADLEEEPGPHARLLLALALPWVLDTDLEYHLGWLHRAAEVAERVENEQARSILRGDRAAVLVAVGDGAGWAEIPPAPSPGAARAIQVDRLRLCTNLAVSAFYLGHDRRAANFVIEGLGLSEETGYERLSPALHTVEALLGWAGGDWEGIETAAQKVIDGGPDVPSLVQATMILGQVALARGELDEAERHSADAAARAGRCGALPTLVMATAALARLRLARGDSEAARTQSVGALEVIAAKGIWPWASGVLPTAVAALLACGSVDEATGWCRRFAAGLRGTDAPTARAALSASRGALAEASGYHDKAGAHFARAEKAWGRVGRPYDKALAVEGRVRCLWAGAGAGDGDGAAGEPGVEELGAAALAAFGSLGAAWDEARLRRLLCQHAVAVQ